MSRTSPETTRHQRRRAYESGAGATEYAAIIVIAMMVAAAVAMAFSGFNIGDKVTCALSSVFGDGGACTSADDGMRVDPGSNVVEDESQTSTGGGSIGTGNPVFNASAGFDDQGQVSYTRNEDGSGQFKITDSKKVEISGSAGKDGVEARNAEVSFEFAAAGSLTWSDTAVYNCANPEECTRFGKENAEEIANRTQQGVRQIANPGADTTIDGKPTSYEKTTSGAIELSAEVGAEFDGESTEISVAAEAAGAATFSSTDTYAADENGNKGAKTGSEFTTQYTLDGSAGASAELVEDEADDLEIEAHAGAQLSGGIGAQVTSKKDAEGNVTELTFQTTSNWSAGANASIEVEGEDKKGEDTAPLTGAGEIQVGYQQQTTVTIDVTKLSPAERQVVENYVNSLASKSPVLPSAALNPSDQPSAGDELSNIIHQRAQVTTSTYEVASASEEGEYNYLLATYRESQEYQRRKLIDQQYLQAPDGSGKRTYADTGAVKK